MAKVNTKVAPYYDDFDPAKQYFQVLALPGRVAQAREITQMQTIVLDVVKNIGNIFLKNGSVVEGCPVIVAPDKKSVTVGAGRVYIEGVVLPVRETVVAIRGTGTEKLGIKLLETIVDESIDGALRDPAQGYDNYDQPGAHRLKRDTAVVVDDPDSASIATFHEGVPVVETIKPEFEGVERTLARRTFDESGSYIVEGLRARVEPNNADFYNVVVEAGKAYVLGFELRKPAPVRIPAPRSKVTNTVTASNYIYSTGQTLYMLDSNPYVKDILSVKGTSAFTENQSLATNVDAVLITQVDVIRLTSISQGQTTYTPGTGPDNGDYYLMRSGSRYYVKWNGNNAPVAGQSYVVTYEYSKEFAKGTDYKLTLTNGAHYLEWVLGGVKPISGTSMTISYQQYLARKDVIYMDQYGEVFTTQGTPTEAGFETIPAVPVNTLALAIVHNPPNGDALDDDLAYDIRVENVGLTRFTMQDIFSLVDRVRRSEYDQALLTLNDDARQRSTVTSKKGIITDPIVDFSKVDLTYNQKADGTALNTQLPLFDSALNFTTSSVSLPLKNYFYKVDLDGPKSSVKKYDRLIALPTLGERSVLSQDLATKSFLVNPYSMFPQLPEVSINPAVDTWIESSTIKVPKSLTQTAIISTSYRHVDVKTAGRWGSNGAVLSSSTSYSNAGSTQDTRSFIDLIQEEAITYCRQNTITVKGNKFSPGVDKIECRFDGKLVNLTPINGTVAGTKTTVNTVKADANGDFQATFVIPAKVLSGIREVEVSSAVPVSGYINSAFTIYQSHGISRVYRETIETITTVLQRKVVSQRIQRSYDPVAQTFVLDQDKLIKGVDVYFEAKSDSVPVSLEIREVINGQLTGTILGAQTLNAAQVSVSADGQSATRFTLPDPVYLVANNEYAFVVRSASDRYRIWVADLGERDVKSNVLVIKNPYLDGVMMSSSNNTTWTPHQTMDIKFRLMEDIFTDAGTAMFNVVNVAQSSRLIISADSMIPQGSDVRWFYQLNNNGSWTAFSPYDLNELPSIYSSALIKAEITRKEGVNLSPLIALDTVSLHTSIFDVTGNYIGNSVQGVDPYTNADIIIDTYIPASTTLTAWVSIDDGATWVSAPKDNTVIRNLNNDWKELTFRKSFATPSSRFKLRVDITTTDPAVTPRFSSVRCILS